MTALLLTLLFLAQGIPLAPPQTGTITGVLKDSAGKPAVNIRVTAVARPESVEDLTAGGATLSGLVPTDSLGRYTLESIPPGRYLVAAGRVDFPTYYPGTQAMVEGKFVTVKAGETTSGIDFTLKDSSGGQLISSGTGTGGPLGNFNVPVDIQVQNGKTPVFGGGKVTGVRLTPVSGGNSVFGSVADSYLSVPATSTDFRLVVEGLPDGYAVTSIKYGSTPITDGILKLTGGPGPVSSTVSQFVVGMTVFGVSPIPNGAAIPQTLTVVLARSPVPNMPGVRVTGQFAPTIRGAFLSGVSATIYMDHSYEFIGVQPGLHALFATSSNSQKTFAASLVVGNQDVKDVELEETTLPPLDMRRPVPPRPAGNRAPGVVPMAAVRGKIIDAETEEPITQGDVFLIGDYWTGRPLNADGKFEFGKLLPGRYEIEVKAVGYPTFRREFQLEEKDVELELKSN